MRTRSILLVSLALLGALGTLVPVGSATGPCFSSEDPDCNAYGCYSLGPLGSDCFGVDRICTHDRCLPVPP